MTITSWGKHRREQDGLGDRRQSAARRGYDHAWQQTRLRVLAVRPLCEDCAELGEVSPATEIHHRVKIRTAPERKHDATNLVALCAECHAARTAKGE